MFLICWKRKTTDLQTYHQLTFSSLEDKSEKKQELMVIALGEPSLRFD
jgi:hypothetical protein